MIFDERTDHLNPLQDGVAAALDELTETDAVRRAWAGDHTLWRDEPTEIADRLGWLNVVPEMLVALDELRASCEVAAADADHVLVMGMGGSSLFPEVVARTVRPRPGAPSLHVLDTTDAAAVARTGTELPGERTLHVAASKSGTTIETRCHLDWAWDRHPDPARFAAITDPDSELAALAEERKLAALWENRADIGGRYSALSLFGMVPAILAGADAERLLASASGMAERLRSAASSNPAARLAATMAAGVRAGRDKLTLVLPESASAFGLWLEQLIAESTGKDGTGVIPIAGEVLGSPDDYGNDRLFVVLGGDGSSPTGAVGNDAVAALAEAGHPVVVLPFEQHALGDATGASAETSDALAGLGSQVLLWELATALCGALLDIQPFDQPDVAAAKAATARVLESGLPQTDTTPAAELVSSVEPGDYVAIQAFVDPGSALVERLEAVRHRMRDRLRVATTLGLGPRYLHSTGQLHKGGPASGVFLQVVGDGSGDGGTADDQRVDVPIPGRPYGFATLLRAQAAGDLLTLRDRGRRAGRVSLDELEEIAR